MDGFQYFWLKLWARDGWILSLLMLSTSFSALFAFFVGESERFSILIYPGVAIFSLSMVLLGSFIAYSLYLLFWMRPHRPFTFLVVKVKAIIGRVGVASVAVMMLFFSFFFSALSSLKTLIPIISPFHWDYFFSEMDRALLGGYQAWNWVHPMVTSFDMTMLINALYNGWFFFVFGMLFWQILDVSRPSRRERYLISYILCWVINGTVLAMIFSSAGPAFYGRLYVDQANPYQPLMTYLATANEGGPVWALGIQDYLWDVYSQGALRLGSGISAMPSMHVSLAWLGFLHFCKVHVGLATLVFGYVLVVLVGSVHLAWHYAVDGLLAILTTTVIWLVVGAWVRSRERRSPPFQGRAADIA